MTKCLVDKNNPAPANAEESFVTVDSHEMEALLEGGAVVLDPDIMASCSSDRADLVSPELPGCVVRPRTTEQVQMVMRWAYRHGVTVVPRGSGTLDEWAAF